MPVIVSRIAAVFILSWVALSLAACTGFVGDNRHNVPLSASTVRALSAMGSSPTEAMMIRIFKQESQLEVWKRTGSGEFRLFRSYEICKWSGNLGPKMAEGDYQSPEGFYTVTPGLMNPRSAYHLSFNLGFPNKFDRAHGRTGSNLMVHGDCLSVGCYAMTDEGVSEIYALVRDSFKGGNAGVQVQVFPFRMTPQNLVQHVSSPHYAFWQNLKEGYDHFEVDRRPPLWDVCEGRYVFNAGAGPLDALGPCPALTRSPALAARMTADEQRLSMLLAADQRAVHEQAVIAARGQAISAFFGQMFGQQPAQETAPTLATASAI